MRIRADSRGVESTQSSESCASTNRGLYFVTEAGRDAATVYNIERLAKALDVWPAALLE